MEQIRKVLIGLAESVSTPRALSVAILARYGEWSEVQNLRLRHPTSYVSSEEYFKDALVTEFLRKCDLAHLGERDLEREAINLFWELEAQNARTNAYLHSFLPEHLYLETPAEVAVHDFILEWRKEMKAALPSLPDSLVPRFSQGATYADTGALITIPDKMSSVPTVYNSSIDLLGFVWETSWGRAMMRDRRVPTTVRGNIFFTVPKDSDKHRGCGKEASIPVSLQLDTARVLRVGLRKIGIDLATAKEQHQQRAREGSIDGQVATLDLSNASDTICRVLPKLILPEDWFALLNSLRASHTRIKRNGKDVWVRLEKFSSMGNGFTFELETLLFATLARVCERMVANKAGRETRHVSCFGDDLIVSSDAAALTSRMLETFGFTLNKKKSFAEGPFRESCGGDFFNGEPVRAHYLKELPDEPQKWIALANGLRRVDPTMRWVKKAWLISLSFLPKQIRECRGPSSLGDLVINDDIDRIPLVLTPDKRDGTERVRLFRTYAPVRKIILWHHWKPEVVLACTTLGLQSTGVSPRGISGYRLTWTPEPGYSDWLPN